MKVLAIDIGGTKVATALIDENLNISQRKQIPSTVHNAQSFEEYFAKVLAKYNPDDYEGLAIGTAGIVDNGILTCLTKTSLGDLDGLPFIDIFKRLSGNKPVLALNDAQAATWAEYINAKHSDMCYITVSTGLGGGFIFNHDLYKGKNNLAGHLGHALILMESPVKQVFEDFAIYEDVTCGRAISLATNDWQQPLTTAEVFKAQKEGDAKADAIVKQAAKALASLIANIVVINDIKDFYLGGSVALNTNLIKQVDAILKAMPVQYHANLQKAKCGQDAVLLGAADYYFQRFLAKEGK